MVLTIMVLAVLVLHFVKSAIVTLVIVLPESQGMCSTLLGLDLGCVVPTVTNSTGVIVSVMVCFDICCGLRCTGIL